MTRCRVRWHPERRSLAGRCRTRREEHEAFKDKIAVLIKADFHKLISIWVKEVNRRIVSGGVRALILGYQAALVLFTFTKPCLVFCRFKLIAPLS